jgi:hypothetical protein
MATHFVASAYDPVIGGLQGDVVSFSASGADLATPLAAEIMVRADGNLEDGRGDHVHLVIDRRRNEFHGGFLDSAARETREFKGVLLTKSRSGAGLFVSQGLSGTVTIQY